MFEFVATKEFLEDFRSFDLELQQRIKEKLEFYSGQENPLIFSKKLGGCKNIFRFRSGDYRVIFRLEGKSIILLLVRHRRDVYDIL